MPDDGQTFEFAPRLYWHPARKYSFRREEPGILKIIPKQSRPWQFRPVQFTSATLQRMAGRLL